MSKAQNQTKIATSESREYQPRFMHRQLNFDLHSRAPTMSIRYSSLKMMSKMWPSFKETAKKQVV
jgi:hypothetical protein